MNSTSLLLYTSQKKSIITIQIIKFKVTCSVTSSSCAKFSKKKLHQKATLFSIRLANFWRVVFTWFCAYLHFSNLDKLFWLRCLHSCLNNSTWPFEAWTSSKFKITYVYALSHIDLALKHYFSYFIALHFGASKNVLLRGTLIWKVRHDRNTSKKSIVK